MALEGRRWTIPARSYRNHAKLKAFLGLCILAAMGMVYASRLGAEWLHAFMVFLGLIFLLGTFGWFSEVSYNEIDFEAGVLRRYYFRHPYREFAEIPLGQFQVVMSRTLSNRRGPKRILVELSGRERTLEIACFAQNDEEQSSNDAAYLRAKLADALRLRNLGIVGA